MKSISLKGFVLFGILAVVFSCKNYDESKAYETDASAEVAPSTEISSNAAVENPKSQRKFIRTADAKFEVSDVRRATYAIENATTKFGGFVTNTNLQSHVSERNETKISQDSSLQTIKYTVDNSITIRVPNTKLDTVLRTIGKEIKFLDYRTIKADDVSLEMLAGKMASSRSKTSEKRLEKAIDSKGEKLKSIVDAEDRLDLKKADNDTNVLNTLALQDKVDFSTITLQIYQNETMRSEVIANKANIDAYRPHIGIRIFDGLKTGWYILEGIIAFVVQLWSIILLIIIGIFVYKRFLASPKLKV